MPIARSPSSARIASVTSPAGFVKLTNHACGARSATRARELDHDGNGPQREAQAARPGRLLADDSLVERDALVDDAALEIADADRAEDEVGAVESVVEVASSPRSAVAIRARARALRAPARSAPGATRRRRRGRRARARGVPRARATRRTRAERGSRRRRESRSSCSNDPKARAHHGEIIADAAGRRKSRSRLTSNRVPERVADRGA